MRFPVYQENAISTIMILTLILLTWRIWWAPNNASKWQIGFNWAFKGLNNVSQHNCFITQGSYIGYMFRLIDQSSSGLFSRLSHQVLCTHWDPSVFTSVKYIKSDQLPMEVWRTYCLTIWLKRLKIFKNNIWRLPAKNRVPLPSSCCLELRGLFTGDVGVSQHKRIL